MTDIRRSLHAICLALLLVSFTKNLRTVSAFCTVSQVSPFTATPSTLQQRYPNDSLHLLATHLALSKDSNHDPPLVRIRAPSYGDMSAVANVIIKCFYAHVQPPAKQLYRLGELNRLQQNFPYEKERHAMLVAVTEGPFGKDLVVGFADVDGRRPTNRATQCRLRPYISDLCVDPDYQRQGVAQRLVQACEEFCTKDMKQEQVFIRVEPSNEAAMSMYQKMGYVEHFHPDEPTDKSVVLRKQFQELDIIIDKNNIDKTAKTHVNYGPHVASCHDRDQNTLFIVVGTSHFRCGSAQEVQQVIQEERPDAVVVELDPERLIRLTKEFAISSPDQDFGADFLSAIETARKLDIPLFLGDEYIQETRSRFLSTLFQFETYSPIPLYKAVRQMMFPLRNDAHRVNVLQTFLNDPLKAVPLAVSFGFPLVAVLIGSVLMAPSKEGVTPIAHFHPTVFDLITKGATVVPILLVFFASCKVYNTLIADRDSHIAERSIYSAQVVKSLQHGHSVRKKWTFAVNGESNTQSSSRIEPANMMPLFTLKTPLALGATRNLNLFEPRWLSMIDDLVASKSCMEPEMDENPDFGCVDCVNKFYSTVNINGKEGRFADIIFKRQGRIAELLNIEEGTRPSGARKVYCRIQGRDGFSLEKEDDVLVSKEGYLMVPRDNVTQSPVESASSNVPLPVRSEDADRTQPLKVVVVAGLLHANGIVDYLMERQLINKTAKRETRSTTSVMATTESSKVQ